MKDLWKSGVLILLIIGVLYIIFLRECKSPPPCPAKDEIILKRATWDSIKKIADLPATVHIDTFYLKGDTIWIDKPLPLPDPKDTITFTYQDSLVQSDIEVHYNFRSEGRLLERRWRYKPIQTLIHEIDSIPYPVYTEIIKIVNQPQNGLYIYGTAGGNANAFIFGGGLDFITKKNTELGYMYQRFGTDRFHSFKLGVKIFNKK